MPTKSKEGGNAWLHLQILKETFLDHMSMPKSNEMISQVAAAFEA
jgi:hypothetical protein